MRRKTVGRKRTRPSLGASQRRHKARRRKARRAPQPHNWYHPELHGRILPLFLSTADVKENKGKRKLFDSLLGRFDAIDVVNVVLAELSVAEYERIARGLQFENNYLTDGREWQYQHAYSIARYTNAARNNFIKNLQTLLKLQKESEEAEMCEFEVDDTEQTGSASETREEYDPPDQRCPSPSDLLPPDAFDPSYKDAWDAQVPADPNAPPPEGQAPTSVLTLPTVESAAEEPAAADSPTSDGAAGHAAKTNEDDLRQAA